MTTRKLIFRTTPGSLTKNTYLLLTFDAAPAPALFKSQLPVAWKVLKFGSHSAQVANVTYTARFGMGVAQIDEGVVQEPETHVEIAPGQVTTFKVDADGFGHFDEPTPKPAPGTGLFSAKNDSGTKQDMTIGLMHDDKYETVLVFPQVVTGSTISCDFTPRLRIYAYSEYKETELIRSEVESPLLGMWDLNKLSGVTAFRVTEQDGQLHINQEV